MVLIAGVAAGIASAASSNHHKLVLKGRAEADILWRRGYTLGDTALDRTLQLLTDSLVTGQAIPEGVALRVRVIRNPVANAFALPDGSIFIFAGLLAKLTSLDQLAFILAHEARHSLDRHALKQMESTHSKIVLLEAVSIATSLTFGGSLIGELAQLGLGLTALASINGHGRELERDADLVAAQELTAAGFDPCGPVTAIQAMMTEGGEPSRIANVFWGSHPLLTDRAKYLQPAAGGAACVFDSSRVDTAYAAIKWRMTRLSADLWVADRKPDKALQVAAPYAAQFPDDPDIHLTIGDALAISASPETLRLAEQSYLRAQQLAPENRLALRGLATVAESLGDTTACIGYLERYLEGDARVRDRRSAQRKLDALKQSRALPVSQDPGREEAAQDSTEAANRDTTLNDRRN